MKRQQAEAVLNRFFEECGDRVPAQSEIDPVLDRVWERLEWEADEFASEKVAAAPARPFRFAWAVGMGLAVVLVNVLLWRYGPPFSLSGRSGKSNETSMSKSSSQGGGLTRQLTVPEDAFELASVKLLSPSSEAAKTANMIETMQSTISGCNGGGFGTSRLDPGRLMIPYMTVLSLVMTAYGQDCTLVEGGPAWARSGEYYEVQALLPAGIPGYTLQDLQKGNASRLQKMLQKLLADRFRLVLKHELREMPVYALTVASRGKLKLSPDETLTVTNRLPPPPGLPVLPMPPMGRGQNMRVMILGEVQISAHAISMTDLAKILRPDAGRIVVDKTGVSELFDMDLKFSRDAALPTAAIPAASPQSIPPLPAPTLPGAMPLGPPPVTQPLAPPLRNVIEDQLGLKLESARMPIEVLIIERVERPSEN
jgi:uncharacterized protein (TIGR03435 family)